MVRASLIKTKLTISTTVPLDKYDLWKNCEMKTPCHLTGRFRKLKNEHPFTVLL